MPIVPSYDNFRTRPSTDGFGPVSAGFNAEAAAGEQAMRAGAALSGVGEAAQRLTLDVHQQVNQTRVNDAVNQARAAAQALAYDPQVGYLNQRGLAALKRESGQALPEEYGQKLDQQFSSISGALDNDMQRQMFAETAGRIGVAFRGEVEGHMLKEFTGYRVSTLDGTIDLATNDAKTSWSDPGKIQPALDAAKAAVVEKGRTLGWAATQIDAALLKTVSGVHSQVVMTALDNGNPTYALGYLDRNKGQMAADDILRVQGHVNREVWGQQAQQAVAAATTTMVPKAAPTDFDRLVQITIGTESGGRRFGPDGKTLLTSPKGAKGEMQVLDSTMRAPGLGLKGIDPDTATPDQRAEFGRQYLQALLQKYGDPAKAWAAYNAGPGRVDQELKDAVKRGEPNAWLSNMPAETRAYVAKNMAALQAGQGAPPRPTEADFIDAALSQLPPGAPVQVVTMTRTAAAAQFGVLQKSLDQQADTAVRAAQQWVVQNPGVPVDRMPASVRDGVVRWAPDKFSELERLAKAVDAPDTKTNPAVYQRLSNPDVLKGLSDGQFFALRAELSESDFKHFSGQRAALVAPKPGTEPGNADTSAIKGAVDENLRGLAIDPSPKDDGGADAARVGAIRKFVTDEVLRAQQLAGKKFNDAELRQKVNELFARQGTISHLFGSDDAAPMLTMKVGDIPGKVRDALRADFAKQGVTSPTDAQVLGAYWTLKARMPKVQTFPVQSKPTASRVGMPPTR